MTSPAGEGAVSTGGEWEIETMLEIIGSLFVLPAPGMASASRSRRIEDAVKKN
jgi:hypothetical protein